MSIVVIMRVGYFFYCSLICVSYELMEMVDMCLHKTIMSLHMDESSETLLINFAGGDIHLFDLDTMVSSVILTGQRQGRFVLRPTLGGKNHCFTISGSEDSKVYIWHTPSGKLLAALKGHSGTVSCVAWRPGNREMFASASDDHTIRVWCTHEVEEPYIAMGHQNRSS